MAQSHEDLQHSPFMQQLRARADRMSEQGKSVIAGGSPGEEPKKTWLASNGVHSRHLPDDQQGILRISCGGGNTPVQMDYLTIRGGVEECKALLEKALQALNEYPTK